MNGNLYMPRFKNREEYERWKAQRKQDIDGVLNRTNRLTQSKSFIENISGVFTYPFHGDGTIVIIAGIAFFTVIGFFRFLPLIGILISLFITGYLCAYAIKIIASTGNGEDTVPNWPDFSSFLEDIFTPLFLVIGTVAFSLIPAFAFYYFKSDFNLSDPLFFVLVILGLAYMPMGFIAVSINRSLMALNLPFVLYSISRVIGDYVIACITLFLIIAIRVIVERIFGSLPIPLLGSVINSFISIYFLIIMTRVLSLLYFVNKDRLNWFGEY